MFQEPNLPKVVLIGCEGCGKTKFLQSLCGFSFEESYVPTLGVDVRLVPIREDTLISFWEIGGKKEYQAFGEGYLIGSKWILLFIDVTNRESLNIANEWLHRITSISTPDGGLIDPNLWFCWSEERPSIDFSIVVVASKCDCLDRVISREEVQEYALEKGFPFVEISTKERRNMLEPFVLLNLV